MVYSEYLETILQEAQKGIAFAAFLKLLMPIIVVLPGIAAIVIVPDLQRPDEAYPQLMNLMPSGLKGLIFAALVAAIVSSMASMTNSIATIFTMDLYKNNYPNKAENHYVIIGRTTSVSALVIAAICARPLLGEFDQAFQYIQEFTGFFTPGIVVLFLLGMFWKKTTANGGLAAAIGSAVFSIAFKLLWPELPFMDRVGLVFLICLMLGVVISLAENKGVHKNAVDIADTNFATSTRFNLTSLAIFIILVGLYTVWW